MKVSAPFLWCVLSFSVSLISIMLPTKALANVDILSDGFNILNENNWSVNPNTGGKVEIVDSEILKISAPYGSSFPYLYLKNAPAILNDHPTIELKFQFSGNLNYGNGIIFSDKLLTNGNNSDLSASDVIFQIWPNGPSTAGLWTTLCNKTTSNCTNGSYTLIKTLSFDSWHTLRIEEKDNSYLISIDDHIFETSDNSRKVSQIWFGNPQTTNTSVNWASILVDTLLIYKNNAVSNTPVVLAPGFGASWDMKALLNGREGNNWKIPEEVTVYNGLIDSLKNAGYKENEDLFVFNYDWRKPLNNLADDLKTFIESKNLHNQKIDIVGHSMGGLVARTYAQKFGVDKINKITTSGSPHLGVVDAYGLWEGAMFWDDIWWEKALIEVATQTNHLPGESKVETLRRISPSIKDLLPVTDFLKLNGQIVPWGNLKQKNTHWSSLDTTHLTALDNIIVPFWSSDQQTRSTINAVKPNGLDNLWKKWEDGKPASTNPFSFSDGDGTVTKQSATGPFTHSIKAVGSHVDLMTKDENIKSILNNLNINSDSVVGVAPDNRKGAFVAVLRSPGKLKVCDEVKNKCDGALGIYLPEDKIFILPGYANEKINVQVLADGLGEYSLHLGNLADEGQWEKILGNIKSTNQVDSYSIQGESMQVTSEESTGARSLLAAKAKLRINSSNWDKINLSEKLVNTKQDARARMLSANLLRLSLKEELEKAKRTNNNEYLERIVDVWNAIDEVTEKILTEKKSYRLGVYKLRIGLSWYFNQWSGYHKFESDKYRGYFSSVLIDLASDKYNEAKETPSGYPSLKADRVLQAEMLTRFAKEVK